MKPTVFNYADYLKLQSELEQVKVERENTPLSLEELRGMDGEAVYCIDHKGNGSWALVHTSEEVCTDANYGDWEFYCYGWRDGKKLHEDGWLAYKGKPLKEDNA